MKTSLSNRFYGPQTTPVVSRCRRIRDPISYQQPSTVSGEAHTTPSRMTPKRAKVSGQSTSVLRQRFVKYFLSPSRIWSAVLCQTNGLGFSFHWAIHWLRSVVSSVTDRWAERRNVLLISALAQLHLVNLTYCGPRKFVDDLNDSRHLGLRKMLAAPIDDLPLCNSTFWV